MKDKNVNAETGKTTMSFFYKQKQIARYLTVCRIF